MKIDYKQALDDIVELSTNHIVISGYVEITKIAHILEIRNFTNESYYVLMGKNYPDEMIISAFNCDIRSNDDTEREGFYYIQAILSYDGGQYDSYGRCECRPYLEIEHIEYQFDRTFESVKREELIDEILDDDFFNLLK